MRFQLVLQDNTQKAYRHFIGFILFFHLAAAAVLSGNTGMTASGSTLYITTGFFLLLAMLFLLFGKKGKGMLNLVAVALLLSGLFFWFRFAGWLAALLFAVVGIIAVVMQGRQTIVTVSDDGVQVKRPTGTTRYAWSQLSNLVLKDGLLTIDLQNNKMIQAPICDSPETTDEKSFNSFCAAHLPNNK